MRIRGSVTVFLALLLTIIFSGIYALLECARVSCIRANVKMNTLQAGDGLLSSYDRPLWDNYHLLFWKGDASDFPELSRACACQQEVLLGNTVKKIPFKKNFFVCAARLDSVTVEGYQLATDDGGAAFRAQAARMMKREVVPDAVGGILDMVKNTGGEESEEQASQNEQNALQTLDDLQKRPQDENPSPPSAGDAGAGTTDAPEQEVPENPIEWMKKVKKKGGFAFLMPEKDISKKKLILSETVGRRNLNQGTLSADSSGGVGDKVLFRLYLDKYFSSATDDDTDGALDYQIEYLIAGRASDKANLRAVTNRLLLIREGFNLAFLEKDMKKKQLARAAAVAITSACLAPEFEEAVTHGILIAWAFAESLSDVRMLLDGGKVPLKKTEDQWHTSLENLSDSVQEGEAEEQEKGLSYENYLQALLWTVLDSKLTCRAMDLIEKDLNVRMDEMVARMDCSYEYDAPALFWSFVSVGSKTARGFCFSDSASLSYLKKGG